ncbi:DUF4282 domain-containing protein [Paeniglutamicibacter kerguelensis]|uniref:DUF4282 domain-containing protein n=1 Tax=Paeniglutamicibacter kerguelensis TaxID=254788 RepID=A0ABS4XGM1_9MICC|nr:DUF4282 domain-containing protein [Paeniglutamicibacter kerguelensis]MBP2387461.1 hypothetical protein [Paeniglutamicibacter kerguelensis]
MKQLFDFNFGTFVTPKIVKIVYILITIGLAVLYLGMVIASFTFESPMFGILVLLVIGPLVTIIYLALARMGLESLVATIRTAQNTGELVRLAGGSAPGPSSVQNPYPGTPMNPPPAPPATPYDGGQPQG